MMEIKRIGAEWDKYEVRYTVGSKEVVTPVNYDTATLLILAKAEGRAELAHELRLLMGVTKP
jgi:hypothetical protein